MSNIPCRSEGMGWLIQIIRRHDVSPAADSNHSADSRWATAAVSAAPARCDVQEGAAQPARGGGES